MKKIISYSIFGSRTTTKENRFEFYTYLRGFVFNTLMNSLIYPSWQTYVNVDSGTFSDFDNIFFYLKQYYNIGISVNQIEPLCKGMLRRLSPLFLPNTDYLICRDADALTTYRESQAVQDWISSGLNAHAILDNPAHAGMMGGMIGFKGKKFRDTFGTWDNLIKDYYLEDRGSDQQLIAQKIEPYYQNDIHWNKNSIPDIVLPEVKPSSKESNLCVRHIGSAGFVEFETVRFFKRRNIDIDLGDVGVRYPKIFNWIEQ